MINSEDIINKINYRYNYFNLDTHFKCSGTINKSDFTRSSCFAKALKTTEIMMDNTYNIKMFKRYLDKYVEYDNLCMFTMDEINDYMNYLNEIYPFEYSIEDNEYDYIINIHINDYHFVHTFIITAIRYLYEVNYSIVLNEAMLLKKTYLFRNLNILSLMCLVVNSNPSMFLLMNDDMSHFTIGNFKTYINIISTDELKKQIEEAKIDVQTKEDRGDTLVGFRRIVKTFGFIAKNKIKLTDVGIDRNSYVNMLTNDNFSERYKIYRSNFFAIKRTPAIKEEDLSSIIGSYSNKKYNFYVKHD